MVGKGGGGMEVQKELGKRPWGLSGGCGGQGPEGRMDAEASGR